MELGLKRFTGRVSDKDLRLLRTFATVVKHGGFVAAESELQIGLPSISRYIKDLEIRLGARLCERGRRGFTLTAEGARVHEACEKLFDELDLFEARVRDIHASPAGAIRIGMVDALVGDPNFRLPEVFDGYKAAYPNVHFNISTTTSNLIEQAVIENNLDVGVVFERRPMEQLRYHFLYEEVSWLYCTEDHPAWRLRAHDDRVDLEDIASYDFVGYPFEHEMERLGVSGLLKRTATVTHMESIAMMIASGRYLGFLTEHQVAGMGGGKRFHKVAPETFSYASKISVITRQGHPPPLVAAFIQQVEAARARVN
ncbi:LysR family transcriptional regulator [Caulobacter sp. D4A]|uniref:LysR family transcriptional regulator n=1 Tax=unclassified Caulobacter TaxID=2648921 RepID=UPI000D72F190|nr:MULTISPECIES: LysR family transcriptional regulator [unclassified Caulobacter]PXA70295.1 LysR family transcriptional regulator [Caulobacter sp. D4A]PXA95995.1 LysR family transcriptional regulator [Caulobacter sp. D5]